MAKKTKKNKQMQIRTFEPKPKVSRSQITEKKEKISFDSWWLLVSSLKNIKPELKDIVQKHFRARGYWEKQDWDNGLKDFGIK